MKFTIFKLLFAIFILASLMSFLSAKRYKNKKSHLKNIMKFLAKRGARTDDDIPDPEVVYSIKLTSHKNSLSSCPYPMTVASSNCPDYSCDLNDGNGGNYIYLCVGKKKISQLSLDEKFLTTVKININNKDCGNLNLLDSKIENALILSDNVYICSGTEDSGKPIKDVTIYVASNPYQLVPDNCLEISKNKYICMEYELTAPKKIEYSELNLLTNDNGFKSLGKPDTIAEIDNDNGSGKSDNTIKRSVMTTIAKSSAWNIENKFGAKVDVKFDIQTPVIAAVKLSVTASFDVNYSKNRGKVDSESESITFDFGCLAPAGKYYKCKAFINKYEVTVPYTIKRKVTMYDNTVQTRILNNNFNSIMSSSMRYERCCYRNCDLLKDKLCANHDNNSQNICPHPAESAVAEAPATTEKIILDPLLDPEVITDIKVVEGKTTNCANGYIKAICFDKDKPCDVNNAYSNSNKAYLCIKKSKLSKVDGSPINVIRLNRFNKDCGTLTLISTKIGESEIYVCFGNDKHAGLAPIVDIRISRKADSAQSATDLGFECDLMNIVSDYKVCYSRNKNAPLNIEVKDFVYNIERMTQVQVGAPKKVSELIVDSASLSYNVRVTKKTESSLKKSFDFGQSVVTALTGTVVGIMGVTQTSTLNNRITKTEEVKDSTETVESTTMECAAIELKKMKCISSLIDYKLNVPYTAKLISYDYEGKEMVSMAKQISGVFEGTNSGNINIKSCCLEGCCTLEPNEENVRPHCVGAKKDLLCSELDRCFNPSALIAISNVSKVHNVIKKMIKKQTNIK